MKHKFLSKRTLTYTTRMGRSFEIEENIFKIQLIQKEFWTGTKSKCIWTLTSSRFLTQTLLGCLASGSWPTKNLSMTWWLNWVFKANLDTVVVSWPGRYKPINALTGASSGYCSGYNAWDVYILPPLVSALTLPNYQLYEMPRGHSSIWAAPQQGSVGYVSYSIKARVELRKQYLTLIWHVIKLKKDEEKHPSERRPWWVVLIHNLPAVNQHSAHWRRNGFLVLYHFKTSSWESVLKHAENSWRSWKKGAHSNQLLALAKFLAFYDLMSSCSSITTIQKEIFSSNWHPM